MKAVDNFFYGYEYDTNKGYSYNQNEDKEKASNKKNHTKEGKDITQEISWEDLARLVV